MIKIISLIILGVFFISLCFSQTLQNLSEQEKTQILRLNEMAETFIQQGDPIQGAQSYTQIAKIYWTVGRLNEAIDYYLRAVEYFMQKNKNIEVRNIYTNIAVIYTDLEELEFALEYFQKSLEIRKKIGDKSEIAAGLIDIAYIMQILRYNDDAIKNIQEALVLATEENNEQLILDCYQLLALNYEQAGNIKKSKEFQGKWEQYQAYLAAESMKETYDIEVIETQKKVAATEEEKRLAAELFALRQVLFEQTQDSLSFTIRSKQDSLFEQAQLAKEKALELDNLTQLKKIHDLALKEQEAKAKIQGLIILMVAIGLVLMVFLAMVMFRANRTRKKSNIKLEKQNKEIAEKSEQLGLALKKIAHQNQNITQSINYAQGIQRALLPKTEQLNDFIKDAFILFKPRDIVSGDFYWFREIDAQSNIFKIFGMHRREDDSNNKEKQAKKFIVSAVDCTGHGVPGAFMSMIGYNLLDEITNKGITRPDLILEELHRGVRFALKQKETNNQDGMDMAICVIDKEKKTMEFAGAKNPLIYIQNGEVQQIKGDKNGIGGKSDDHKFEAHTIDVSQPTWVYMFTDGYIDQFGGDQGRKFMIKNFRELLLEIHTMPMNQQKEYLDKAIKDWIGTKYSQIDDLLVMGFKLDLNGVS
jgi:serine phosphatase RsbU (regulator of sigma subunit)